MERIRSSALLSLHCFPHARLRSQPITRSDYQAFCKPCSSAFRLGSFRYFCREGLMNAFGNGYLVDDALDEDDADVDAAGDVGEELGDEVIDRGQGEADGVTGCAGRKVGLLPRNI